LHATVTLKQLNDRDAEQRDEPLPKGRCSKGGKMGEARWYAWHACAQSEANLAKYQKKR
jgi:hypothetical protein